MITVTIDTHNILDSDTDTILNTKRITKVKVFGIVIYTKIKKLAQDYNNTNDEPQKIGF
jgi:hypothetical protein